MKNFLSNKTRGLNVKVGLREGTHLINKENGQKRKNGHVKQNKNKTTSNWYLTTKNSYVYFFLKRGGGKKPIQAPLQKKPKSSIIITVTFPFQIQTLSPIVRILKRQKQD